MKKTICLNMIVKNENKVIKRCLDSVRSLIDYWIIVDTGSTDGTQEIIKKELSDIPGELHERPWVNFGHNRNEAMELAKDKGDYLLFIDADDQLIFSPDFSLPNLEADMYTILQRAMMNNIHQDLQIAFLIKNEGQYEWRGVLHEYMHYKPFSTAKIELIEGVYNKYNSEGCRANDPNKLDNDIKLLKECIEKDPFDSRNVLYLARTYFAANRFHEAITQFKMRSIMGGDPIEVYYSLLYIGIIQIQLNLDSTIYLNSFAQASIYRPSRSEAFYEIARYYSNIQCYSLGYLFAKKAASIPKSSDNLFVETWVSEWGAKLYLFICSYFLEKHEEAQSVLEDLISNTNLPKNIRESFGLDEYLSYYEKNSINF